MPVERHRRRRLRRAHPSSAGRSRTLDRCPSWRCMTGAVRFRRHARPSRGCARLAEQFDSRRDRVLIVVAGYCGLRWGELAALRWADIDFDLRRLRVSRAYSEEAPRGEMSPVKDHQARTVRIPRTVVDELKKLQAQSAPSELVSPSANSTPLRNRNFRRDGFDAATAGLSLDPPTDYVGSGC